MWNPYLGETLELAVLGSTYKARVLGIATYLHQPNQYYVEYLDSNGNPFTSWVYQQQLNPLE